MCAMCYGIDVGKTGGNLIVSKKGYEGKKKKHNIFCMIYAVEIIPYTFFLLLIFIIKTFLLKGNPLVFLAYYNLPKVRITFFALIQQKSFLVS